jgi:hypothetical protein
MMHNQAALKAPEEIKARILRAISEGGTALNHVADDVLALEKDWPHYRKANRRLPSSFGKWVRQETGLTLAWFRTQHDAFNRFAQCLPDIPNITKRALQGYIHFQAAGRLFRAVDDQHHMRDVLLGVVDAYRKTRRPVEWKAARRVMWSVVGKPEAKPKATCARCAELEAEVVRLKALLSR